MATTYRNRHLPQGHGGPHRHHRPSHADGQAGADANAPSRASPASSPQRPIRRIPVVSSAPPAADKTAATPPKRDKPPTVGGKTLSLLCVATACAGLAFEMANEWASHINQTNTLPVGNVASVMFGAGSLVLGSCALHEQRRHWSFRTRRRLLFGMPVAGLTLLSVLPNFWEAPVKGRTASETPARAEARTASTNTVDDALVKPGWYGEYAEDGVVVALASFEQNAIESQRFNRRLHKPVSYAALTVINLGHAAPIVLNNLRVGLRLDSGETVQSLAIEPLLRETAGANDPLLKRLSPPLKLSAGEMLPDVPVCMEAGFPWSRVTAAMISLADREVSIPGRMMTAAEKNAMLEKNAAAPSAAKKQGSAEAWFKDL